jgi:AraC family transcriptional regulator
MQSWEAIQAVLDHIEDHLTEEFTVKQAARSAALSPYYFQRLFSKLVGRSFVEYIRLRKLATASRELLGSQSSIADIAAIYGYTEPANFTRVFREAYGISPQEYREHVFPLRHCESVDLRLTQNLLQESQSIISGRMTMVLEKITLPSDRKFRGVVSDIPADELVGSKNTCVAQIGRIWVEYHQIESQIPGWQKENACLGMVLGNGKRSGFLKYLTAVEVDPGSTDPGRVEMRMPAGPYIVCSFEAPDFGQLVGPAMEKAYACLNRWVKEQGQYAGTSCYEIYPANPNGEPSMQLFMPLTGKKLTPEPKPVTLPETMQDLSMLVHSLYWDDLIDHLITEYQVRPEIDFSRCKLKFGQNVKFKKAGRSLCTLYPNDGWFTALVVISERERIPFEMELPFMSAYLQQLYQSTSTGMGQKWLMIDVTTPEILADVKKGIAIRRGVKKGKGD